MPKQVADCMFCSQLPCVCNLKPKKTRRPRTKTDQIPVAPSEDITEFKPVTSSQPRRRARFVNTRDDGPDYYSDELRIFSSIRLLQQAGLITDDEAKSKLPRLDSRNITSWKEKRL